MQWVAGLGKNAFEASSSSSSLPPMVHRVIIWFLFVMRAVALSPWSRDGGASSSIAIAASICSSVHLAAEASHESGSVLHTSGMDGQECHAEVELFHAPSKLKDI